MKSINTASAASLATGAPINPDTWADFVRRLYRDCMGEGVSRHYTADAIFIVQARRLIFGIDKDYTDRLAVICDDQHWCSPKEYWDDRDEEDRAAIDRLAIDECGRAFLDLCESDQWGVLEDLDEHSVVGFDERWDYVCAHLTQDAAEAFIARKKHDYREGLRIYVDAQTYAWEFNAIKEAILDGRLRLVEAQPEEIA